MTGPPYHGRTHRKGGTDPIDQDEDPNLICDDMEAGAFEFPWSTHTPGYTTTFSGGAVLIQQPSFASDSFRFPASSNPPVIRDEWAEFAFSMSVDTLSGYSVSSTLLALIKGEAVNGSSTSNALIEVLATHVAGTLKFKAGTATVVAPTGTTVFTNNLTNTSLAIAAGVLYDVKIRARVTDKTIYSQLIVDEALLLDLSLANPTGGSGGLTETGVLQPEWGATSLGTGTPPTWTFDSFRYAIKSTDRRPCAEIVSPYT